MNYLRTCTYLFILVIGFALAQAVEEPGHYTASVSTDGFGASYSYNYTISQGTKLSSIFINGKAQGCFVWVQSKVCQTIIFKNDQAQVERTLSSFGGSDLCNTCGTLKIQNSLTTSAKYALRLFWKEIVEGKNNSPSLEKILFGCESANCK